MSRYFYTAIAAFAAIVSAPVSANILVNGGFEDIVTVPYHSDQYAPGGHVQNYPNPAVTAQYLPGWTIEKPYESDLYRGAVVYGLVPAAAAEGSQYMSLNWSPAGGITLYNSISQAFTLGSGATGFAFSVMMGIESGFDGSTLQVAVLNASGTVVAQSGLFNHTAGNRTWSQKEWSASLGAGTYTLRLSGVGAGNAWDVLLDNAVLTQVGSASAVPEPASWAMLLTGFALTGVAIRRRALIQRVAA